MHSRTLTFFSLSSFSLSSSRRLPSPVSLAATATPAILFFASLMEEVDAPSPRPINSVVDSSGASGAVTPGTEGGAMDVDQPSPRLLMPPPPPPPATAANKA
ncbi:hypothetical protein Tsubulata_042059 [Turnera subulata]|uniref:Uncharacterized protein n=1 Tax=Turnera subulata TaxID=218843 RepID=A0A9Q0GIP8_9ROSI|nr:hypothetical protein Tsubulata_042059 [Turnera subulata]